MRSISYPLYSLYFEFSFTEKLISSLIQSAPHFHFAVNCGGINFKSLRGTLYVSVEEINCFFYCLAFNLGKRLNRKSPFRVLQIVRTRHGTENPAWNLVFLVDKTANGIWQHFLCYLGAVIHYNNLTNNILQLSYIEDMAKMKKEQFDESVNRALYQASRNLEMDETSRYLEKDVNATERRAFQQDSLSVDGLDGSIRHSHQFSVSADDGTVYSSFQLKTFEMKPASVPKAMIMRKDKNSLAEASKTMQEIVRKRYVYQKALLDEVIYSILYTASDKPLKERVNFKLLDRDIHEELLNNGIDIPYHFTVSTADGREVYRCPDYTDEGKEYSYTQSLFQNDPPSKMGIVRIHFPEISSYIFSGVRFMIPSIVFTCVLLITFIFTIAIIFRQKRYSEMKNDFVNNMTHELKTPIASISLAAQMLCWRTLPTRSPCVWSIRVVRL